MTKTPTDTAEAVSIESGTARAAAMRQDLDQLYRATRFSALIARGDEVLWAMYRDEKSGTIVVVFDRRYGATEAQGIRTVVVTVNSNQSEYVLVADAFAPGMRRPCSGTGTVDNYKSVFNRTGSAAPVPAPTAAPVPAPTAAPVPPPTAAPVPARRLLPTDLLGVTVHLPGAPLKPGWYVEYTARVEKPRVGPFETLTELDTWLHIRAAIVGRRVVELNVGESIFNKR